MPKKIEYELYKEFESFAELMLGKYQKSFKNSVRSRCTSCIASTHDKRTALCILQQRRLLLK